MKFNAYILIPTFLGLTLVQAQQKNTGILPNENLITENIAFIPKELAVQVKKYSEARGASLAEIHPVKNDIIITTRCELRTYQRRVSDLFQRRGR